MREVGGNSPCKEAVVVVYKRLDSERAVALGLLGGIYLWLLGPRLFISTSLLCRPAVAGLNAYSAVHLWP